MAAAVSLVCSLEDPLLERPSLPVPLWRAEGRRAPVHRANQEVRREVRGPVRARGALLPEGRSPEVPQVADRKEVRPEGRSPEVLQVADRKAARPEGRGPEVPQVADRKAARPEGRSPEVPQAPRP